MSALYIQIENGQPVNHPAYGGNLLQFYPSIPENWQPFKRIERPKPKIYQVVAEQPTYEFVDDVWTDVWAIRDMTPEEKQAKIDAVMALPHPDGWVFDEEICRWKDPKIDINAPGSPPSVIS
jgi:hypothetical protein